jgi:hypothetical protein
VYIANTIPRSIRYPKTKFEAAYFFETDEDRIAAFIVDMQSADQIPFLVEALSQGRKEEVELRPVMIFDDLKQAFSKGKQDNDFILSLSLYLCVITLIQKFNVFFLHG